VWFVVFTGVNGLGGSGLHGHVLYYWIRKDVSDILKVF
jgi:hypothetical protein